MKVTIVNKFTAQGQEFYDWSLSDGPDGIEEVRGYAVDLITAFSKVLEWHERIASEYADELLVDIETAKQFTQSDETHD